MLIELPQLRMYARHGVLPQERTTGADFSVSLILHIDDYQARGAWVDDQLADTINYAEVYDAVREEMAQPSQLLEHVVGRIARTLLRRFALLREVEVGLTKCAPPIPGYDGAGVTVRYRLRRRLMAWDFDGTLADTSEGIIRTMTATLQECGQRVASPEEIAGVIGLPLAGCIRTLTGLEGEALQQAVDTYRRIFEEIGNANVRLFPGIAEVLERHHREGFFIGIATSRSHASTEALCERLGIGQWIDAIVAADDAPRCKPAPEHLHQLCQALNVLPEDTIMVGDTAFDIEMGRSAKAACTVGVTWGNHSPEQLTEAGAQRIVNVADDLHALPYLTAVPASSATNR